MVDGKWIDDVFWRENFVAVVDGLGKGREKGIENECEKYGGR
jgi:hypothetical protein